MIESTLRRVFLLTFSPTLRYALGQERNALDFRAHMDQGISVVYNLGGLDEDTQRFLGCLLTVGYEVAALSRADLPEEARSPYHLIMDEFSMFSAQSEEALARVLSLARKYGLFLTLAHQTWSQLSSRLQGALQNTGVDRLQAGTRRRRVGGAALRHLRGRPRSSTSSRIRTRSSARTRSSPPCPSSGRRGPRPWSSSLRGKRSSRPAGGPRRSGPSTSPNPAARARTWRS